MIDLGAVTQAVRDRVDAGVTVPVTVTTAPATTPRPVSYCVIELPPGSMRTGTVSLPESGAMFRVRVRAVARSNQVDVARREVQRVAHQASVALLDRTQAIAGTGWEVSGRMETGDSGVDLEGEVANLVVDFDLYVSPA